MYLVSEYVSLSTLSHTLWIREGEFQYNSSLDFILTTNITYLSEGGVISQLTIIDFVWGANHRSIIFYTNNPFKID